ncbi:MAG: portal protein [Wendovervirus sonii]|uniref:Portal protein n=1 Tax=phage Lak_Megaphage_Sonny TaxID=3109229 RepID=A0ABZ0Z5F7_9CAUD|nr:MAG: portal protein [phage Lak_Megaphage_Sonny]
MAKNFILRTFKPGGQNHNRVNPLINLSSFGLTSSNSIIQNAMALSQSQTKLGQLDDTNYPSYYMSNVLFNKYQDLTKNNIQNYAFYDMSYNIRCNQCKRLARDVEINFILDTICNEAIVQDENGFIADLDTDRIKLFLNKNYKKGSLDTDKIIHDCKVAYNQIYAAYGWASNAGAWSYFKKFLIEGFLAFEMIFDPAKKNIIGFLNIDPTTLEPTIEVTEDGQELFIWYQFKGSAKQRKIPNSNIIYISWSNLGDPKNNNISYVETLVRPFNVLRQIECSHIVWNTMNAQNRMKITVPVGDLTKGYAEARLSEIKADYDEEVSFDDASGQMLVNGEPKFNFQKTYIFEDRGGQSINIEAVKTDGYNMNSTEELQYFWRKFIMESQVPANRFNLNITSPPNNGLLGESNITREEYAFQRFIQRIQNIFRELLLKPTYTQICLRHPELSYNDYFKQCIGIVFHEENLFTLAKKRSIALDGAQAISTLAGVQVNNVPYFSMEFLIKEYLGLSDAELELNRKYKEGDIMHNIEIAKLQKKHQDAAQQLQGTPQPGTIEGGGGFGGPDVMGGGEFGGPDMGGGFEAPDMGGSEPAPDMGGNTEGGETDMM